VSRKRFLGLAPALACFASAASADPLAITTSGELPFSHDELATALSARVQLATAASSRHIEARVSGDAREVRIEMGDRTRAVALAGEHGADAARLIAMSILDVAGDQLDPPGGTAEAPLEARAVVAPAAVARPGEPWTVALWATAGSQQLAALELDAPVAGRVRVLGSVGAGLATTTGTMSRTIDVRAFPARLELATRVQGFELRAGAVAMIEHASAARSSTDALAGGGAGVVYRLPIAGGVALLAGGGAAVLANAIEYRVGGVTVSTTDRFAWWAGAALAKETRW
jgi:hypothetical protein